MERGRRRGARALEGLARGAAGGGAVEVPRRGDLGGGEHALEQRAGLVSGEALARLVEPARALLARVVLLEDRADLVHERVIRRRHEERGERAVLDAQHARDGERLAPAAAARVREEDLLLDADVAEQPGAEALEGGVIEARWIGHRLLEQGLEAPVIGDQVLRERAGHAQLVKRGNSTWFSRWTWRSTSVSSASSSAKRVL
ncbi:MAG: hypothetical protein M5U28_30650 [Sandaracinaceae bacterium]|nr:hypothetical protein [Sandaracinaceae bacterium]